MNANSARRRPATAADFVALGEKLQRTASRCFGTPCETTLTAYSYTKSGNPNPETFVQTSNLRGLTAAMFRSQHVHLSITPKGGNPTSNPVARMQMLHGKFHTELNGKPVDAYNLPPML